MRSYLKYLLFAVALAYGTGALGQDLESLKTANPITLSGGLGLTGTLYSASGNSRKDPWSYVLNANLNVNLWGVLDLPFSACIMSENKTFNQPTFTRYGVSPRYKVVTAHIGWRSMSFSSYTLSGITFLGGGIEVAPDDFWVGGKAVYGRFNKSVPMGDTLSLSYEQPQYDRWGYGGMVTLGTKEHNVDLILFKARDEKSAYDSVMTAMGIAPQENAVIGLNTRHAFGEHLTFEVEYAFSALTSDINQPYEKFDTYTYANNFGFLFKPRTSSSYHHALRGALGFQSELFSLGLGYNRVDPGYQSLGTLYLTNDFEDVQANGGVNLFKNKLGISGAIGVQRDNLSRLQAATSTRSIGSLNVNYTPLQALSLSGSYSNFSSSSQPNQLVVDDSLKYAQVTDNLSLTAAYSFGEGDYKHALNGAYSQQAASTINSTFTQVDRSVTGMSNVSLGYRLTYAPVDWGSAVNLSYSSLVVDSSKNTSYGCNFSSTKSFFKKQLKATLGYSYLRSSSAQGGRQSNIIRLSLNYGYKKHSLSLSGSGSFTKSHSSSKGATRTQEWMANLSYAYAFSAAIWKAKKPKAAE
ncbi:MAG: hypothetical protein LBK47_09560 [Prevotellaceae bacterium]|jgi:hypothetical protein|nr:hypothetical protein [Prevotellaceae bacterium]